jgi:hypothetical protein
VGCPRGLRTQTAARAAAAARQTFVKTTNGTLGSKYTKAVFRPYTDATFKTRAPHDAALGILGPTLRAEVGDRLVVHFLNRLPFNASVQPFGGLIPLGNTTAYQMNVQDAPATKPAAAKPAAAAAAEPAAAAAPAGRRLLRSPGRRLSQITAAQAEAEAVIAQSVSNIYNLGAVAPGASARYEWLVPDSAGPGPADGDAVAYAYVSGVDHIKHINAGLVGALVVYSKGAAPRGKAAAAELPLLFNIQNEMQSELYQRNLWRQGNETGIKINTAVGACLGRRRVRWSLAGGSAGWVGGTPRRPRGPAFAAAAAAGAAVACLAQRLAQACRAPRPPSVPASAQRPSLRGLRLWWPPPSRSAPRTGDGAARPAPHPPGPAPPPPPPLRPPPLPGHHLP